MRVRLEPVPSLMILEENSTPIVCDDRTLPTSAWLVISELVIQLEDNQGV